jgi:hypothetical protein
VLLAVGVAVVVLSVALPISVTAAELEILRRDARSLDIGSVLFTLLLGLAAVSLLMLRLRLPVKGRERDR